MIGLVADLVNVNVQHAALVDVALGDIAQFVIVKGNKLINQIAAEKVKVGGRVGLIQLDEPPTLGADPGINLNGIDGVIGRADRLVQVQPEYAEFIRKMLGGTWLVKTLSIAIDLRANHESADRVRFITLDGEIVEADGSVVVGPKSTAAGLVSRRSELRALKREIERLDGEQETCRAQVKELTDKLEATENKAQAQLEENTDIATRLKDHQREHAAAEKQLVGINQQLTAASEELTGNENKIAATSQQLADQRDQLGLKEAAIAAVLALVGQCDTSVADLRQQRKQIEKSTSSITSKLAKSEQVLEGMQARVAQFRQELDEQEAAHKQAAEQVESDSEAAGTAEQEIQAATKKLSELREQYESVDESLQKLNLTRSEMDADRKQVSIELRGKQDQLRLAQDKVHQQKSRIEQLHLQRQQLAERMLDDYGIDIAKAEAETNAPKLVIAVTPDDEPEAETVDKETGIVAEEPEPEAPILNRDQIDGEISDLRRKLGSIGSVNLDALQELEDLESRYLAMDQQYQDLVQAKETLQKIITRIDNDSRKLFVETLEIIRGNFQKLFRQTFGGGKADIILEPDVDPLEAGVDIVATPPGKPEFNNSLLSGGEKALTAVSLLMAIFQFRPSPFCVLDEVDAPFDEANIGRFIDVLKSFLGWTKFVIVTHSKKTMTAATTLYGITMQESGVSKRVSVRFEDVSDDGHISEDAIKRESA